MSLPSHNKKSENKTFTQNKVANEGKKGEHNPKSARFCYDIFTEKSCKRGNSCNFRHDKQNITPSEKEEIKAKNGARFRD